MVSTVVEFVRPASSSLPFVSANAASALNFQRKSAAAVSAPPVQMLFFCDFDCGCDGEVALAEAGIEAAAEAGIDAGVEGSVPSITPALSCSTRARMR